MNRAHSEPIHGPIGHGQRRPAFVGGMGLGLGQCLSRSAANNCSTWFKDAEVHYVHAARTAIHKAYSVLGLRPGDEVLVPAYNCGSEVDALIHAGAKVRLYRISRTGQLDSLDLARRITPATRAVYVIHYFGFAQQLGEVEDLCRRKKLFLIEDCAVSAFSATGGRRIGSSGDVAIYNFPKVLPVPDGGALVINNLEYCGRPWPLKRPAMSPILGNLSRLLRAGVMRSLPDRGALYCYGLRSRRQANRPTAGNDRLEMPRSYFYDSSAISDRCLSRISAWLLQRTDLSQVLKQRRRNYSLLLDDTAATPGAEPLYARLPEGACPLYFPILAERPHEIVHALRTHSIPAIPWWAGYHPGCLDWEDFPDACYLKDHVVAIPMHQQLDDAAIGTISGALRSCVAASAAAQS